MMMNADEFNLSTGDDSAASSSWSAKHSAFSAFGNVNSSRQNKKKSSGCQEKGGARKIFWSGRKIFPRKGR